MRVIMDECMIWVDVCVCVNFINDADIPQKKPMTDEVPMGPEWSNIVYKNKKRIIETVD